MAAALFDVAVGHASLLVRAKPHGDCPLVPVADGVHGVIVGTEQGSKVRRRGASWSSARRDLALYVRWSGKIITPFLLDAPQSNGPGDHHEQDQRQSRPCRLNW